MDVVLQKFRRSFGPTTPFFQSLSLDPPATMEELYRRADKYSTLEDNIRATSQMVMITAQSGKPTTKSQLEQKGSQSKSQKRPQEQSEEKKDPPQITPLNISYDRLLPLIQDHPEFKWPPPMRANPDQRNRSLRCDYHRDHDHEMNQCQGLKFMIERLIRAGHLRRFIREPTRTTETDLASNRAVVAAEHSSEPRPTINFILGGRRSIPVQEAETKNASRDLNQGQNKHHQYPRE